MDCQEIHATQQKLIPSFHSSVGMGESVPLSSCLIPFSFYYLSLISAGNVCSCSSENSQGEAGGLTEVGDNTAGFLPVWHKSEWAALRPKFFIFLGQIHPRFCPRHEQRCGFGPSLLLMWFLMVCPLTSSESGWAGLAQGQKCLGKEGQEVEIRVDMQGSL